VRLAELRLCFFRRFVDLVEALDGIEDRLHLADVDYGVEYVGQLELADFEAGAALDYVGALAVRGDQAAAVDLYGAVLADDAELHGEPEEAAHALEVFGVGEAGADLAVVLQEIGEDGVRVHGDVAEDVVEDGSGV